MKTRNALKVIPAFILVYLALCPNLLADGHFELGFHYGTWNLNLLGDWVEDGLSEVLETEFKDVILEEIQKDYPELQDPVYDQTVEFDSGGHNYGFEIRWYPGGHAGSFSLGVSVEKTKMDVQLTEIEIDMTFQDGSAFLGQADGDIILNPLTFLLNVRWDILPKSPIHPYITLGVGAAAFSSIKDDIVSYGWLGELQLAGGPTEKYEDEGSKTIQEIKEDLEDEDFPLSFLPFIQLNLGLKGKLAQNIHLMVDAGIWNGFTIRGGIAIRL
ncbi:MAG: hypothetical protein JSV17_08630 [Candidatus Aminicenantes bacterium]|nr:MAG: hypothetical protein JSV17_08630 [Candidatus Aminicenantes bacterium]